MTNRQFFFDRSLVFVVAISILMIASVTAALGQTENVLYNFTGGPDGAEPGGVIFDNAGNLFGTTRNSVFELSPNSEGGWTLATLYTFSKTAGGLGVNGSLIFDTRGSLYGTTSAGGYSSACKVIGGCGVIFRLSPSASGWFETILYNFTGNADGLQPNGSLIFDAAGNFYGATYSGGDWSCNIQGAGIGCGTVFKLSHGSAGWSLAVLHTFSGGSDGAKRNKEERYGQSGQTKRSRKAHRTKNSRGKRSILSSASLPLVCQYGKPYCLRAIFRKKTGFHQVRRTNLLAR